MMVTAIGLQWNEDHHERTNRCRNGRIADTAAAVRAATTLAKTFGQPLHVVCSYRSPPAADGLALTAA
jgi:hypothetical protein